MVNLLLEFTLLKAAGNSNPRMGVVGEMPRRLGHWLFFSTHKNHAHKGVVLNL
jgi:hypothetical protein